MRILGVDYGTKRIGFAVGTTEQRIAFPRDVAEGRDAALASIKRRTEEEGIAEIVIGMPIRHGGGEGELAGAIRDFARELESRFSLPVHFQNEIFSTKVIRRGTVAKHKVDAASAALILQSYLERIMKHEL